MKISKSLSTEQSDNFLVPNKLKGDKGSQHGSTVGGGLLPYISYIDICIVIRVWFRNGEAV